jgi:chemotaxis protein MotB
VLTRNPAWDLSSSRANRVRLLLQNTGFPSQRVQRVTGFADRVPAARNLMAARNNRIELILLRRLPGRNR